MDASAITVRQVSKTYGRIKAVNELSFTVREASCFGLLGPNGAGKTTMMKMLYGKSMRDNHTGGVIDVFGYDPATDELSIKSLAAVVPQENNLDEELNVYQNLILYTKFYNIPGREARKRIAELLEFLELQDRAKARIKELSGGMKRRLVITRALLNQPRLLILDEPTTGLDPQVRHLIWDKLHQLMRQGITILLTTHYMEEAFQLCDRILIMHRGRNIMEGAPNQLLAENIEPYVLELLSQQESEQISESLPDGIRQDRTSERVLLYSHDLESLQTLTATIHGGEYHLRQSTLEDLFLRATGRGLHEK